MDSKSTFVRAKLCTLIVLLSSTFLGSAFAGVIAGDDEGNLWIWSDEERVDITYKFVGNMELKTEIFFYISHDEMIQAFKAAAEEWEEAAPATGISFRDVTGTPEEDDAMFPISVEYVADGDWNAQAFWPNSEYEPHLIVNSRMAFGRYNTAERIEGLFLHELGHILGLFHEAAFGGTEGLSVGESDAESVMNTLNSPYYTTRISNGDKATIAYAYAYRGTYGDVNLDGVVNTVDALMTAQYSVDMIVDPDFVASAADVNLDNTIDIVDALIISQYTVGLVDMLPYAP